MSLEALQEHYRHHMRTDLDLMGTMAWLNLMIGQRTDTSFHERIHGSHIINDHTHEGLK